MVKIEKLGSLLQKLRRLDRDATIYATEPWTENSDAILARAPDGGGLPETASKYKMRYFLEVGIAADFMEDLPSSLQEQTSASLLNRRLIEYAINDA